jgi:hypothetical protein
MPFHGAQSSGISLQLAPSVEGALPQNYSLREQTENITPTLVFADLAGRLSARSAACPQPHMPAQAVRSCMCQHPRQNSRS